MSRRMRGSSGPSASELKLKQELDRARRELAKLKKEIFPAGTILPASDQEGLPGNDEVASAGPEDLLQRVEELEKTKERLSRLYFNQLDENRKRAHRLQQVLSIIGEINGNLDLEALFERIAAIVQSSLGFRIVLIRVVEPGTNRLRARAFAGLADSARAALEAEDVPLEDFKSWLKDEFRVSHSYFISHKHSFSKILPAGYVPDLGRRQEWEWHEDDVLLVPLYNRTGDLIAYFSVDDPVDRLVPSREAIELLEIFGNHAAVAIENARLYRQLESRTRELEDAGQRMTEINALKNNFVSTISHELRTPLTAIRAYLDTLLAAGQGEIAGDQLRRFLTIINDESQRLARLIESVLDLSRLDSGNLAMQRQRVDMGEILEETAWLLRPVAEAGQVNLKVINELADTGLDADRDQMRQLALHLGGNAVKFTPPGGTVSLRLSGDDQEMTLQVEDSGIGIPEEALEKIFDRFYQVDSSLVRRYGGSGLGLAICKSIVHWHSGRVFAASTPGSGSCFTVVLPRPTGAAVVVRPMSPSQAAIGDVTRLAVEMVAEVMNARVVSLLAVEPDGDLVVQAAVGLEEKVVREARIKPGRGVAGWVAAHRRPLCVARPGEQDEVAGSGRTQYRSGTFLSVPLEGSRELLGVLNVTDPTSKRAFDTQDCALLLDLAERLTHAWEQARSLENSLSGVDGATRALRQLVHHMRIGRKQAPNRVRLAQDVARELHLAEAEVRVIGFAAAVHDVGMTLVSQDILARRGSLSEEERVEMQRHAELGAELLRPLETMTAVRDVILAHHEWWDGSGYPRGLSRQEIPIGARVLAVVDAFESMTRGREYRPSQTQVEALREIAGLGGRQFDLEVVAALQRALSSWDSASPAELPVSREAATSDARR